MTDVVVIGAGPAGSITARTIADAGFTVKLIEKRKPLETKVCGGGIPHELSARLSLPEQIIEKRVSFEIHYFPWGRKIYPNKHVTVRREAFDNFLVIEAEKSGADVVYETIVIDVKRDEDAVFVYTKSKKGEVFCIPCRIVIFADGVGTLVKKCFPSIGFQANLNNTALGVIYDLEFKKNKINHYELYYGSQLSSWGYGWVFPKNDSLNIGVGCLLSDLKKSKKKIASILHRFLTEVVHNPSRFKGKKIEKFGAALIPLRPSRKIFGDSCLVAGDAAGMVDPLLGCGIIHAVSSGKLAGQIAVNALRRGDFSEKYMSRYQILWQQSANYRQIRRNEIIARSLHPFSSVDKNMISKIEYLLLFGKRSSTVENLQALFFPLSH